MFTARGKICKLRASDVADSCRLGDCEMETIFCSTCCDGWLCNSPNKWGQYGANKTQIVCVCVCVSRTTLSCALDLLNAKLDRTI